MFELTLLQQEVVDAGNRCFVAGLAGTGKTTAVQHRLLHLLQSGEPAYTLLTLVAEPEHADRYLEMIHQSGLGPYADLKIITYARLAQEIGRALGRERV